MNFMRWTLHLLLALVVSSTSQSGTSEGAISPGLASSEASWQQFKLASSKVDQPISCDERLGVYLETWNVASAPSTMARNPKLSEEEYAQLLTADLRSAAKDLRICPPQGLHALLSELRAGGFDPLSVLAIEEFLGISTTTTGLDRFK